VPQPVANGMARLELCKSSGTNDISITLGGTESSAIL